MLTSDNIDGNRKETSVESATHLINRIESVYDSSFDILFGQKAVAALDGLRQAIDRYQTKIISRASMEDIIGVMEENLKKMILDRAAEFGETARKVAGQ
jgi:hypothetical protein